MRTPAFSPEHEPKPNRTDTMNALQKRIQQSIEEYEAEREDYRALVRIHEARVDQLDGFLEDLACLQLAAADPRPSKAKPAIKAKP
jgi:hypothetical protein